MTSKKLLLLGLLLALAVVKATEVDVDLEEEDSEEAEWMIKNTPKPTPAYKPVYERATHKPTLQVTTQKPHNQNIAQLGMREAEKYAGQKIQNYANDKADQAKAGLQDKLKSGLGNTVGGKLGDLAGKGIDVAKEKLPDVVANAYEQGKKIVGQKVQEFLQDCAAGRKAAAVAPACKLLVKGLAIGKAYLAVLDIDYQEKPYTKVSGTVDLTGFFGHNTPIFQFEVDAKPGAGVGFVISTDKPVRVSLADVVRVLLPSGLGLGPLADKIISGAHLDAAAIRVAQIAVNIDPYGFQIKGIAEFLGSTTFNFLVADVKGTPVLSFEVNLDGPKIDQLINSALGPIAKIFKVFTIEELNFAIANNDLDTSRIPALKWNPNHGVEKGVAVYFLGRFDENGPSPLGQILAKFLRGRWGFSLVMRETLFKLNLMLPEVHFSERVQLIKNNMYIKAGISPPTLIFGMDSTLRIKVTSDILDFHASINARMHDPSVEVLMEMIGLWRGAFGISGLTFGNVVGNIAIGVRPPWVTMFELGGELSIGQNDPISGKGYFRVDTENPLQNWYFFKLNRLTVGQIFRHFLGINNLPGWLAESGFPQGCQSSFSLSNTATRFGDKIPMGFSYKGKFNLFGYKAFADVNYGPTQFKFYIELDPLSLGPVIQLYRSRSNTNQGPLGHVEGSLKPLNLKAHIECYIKVFLFQVEAKIILEPGYFYFNVKTNIFIFDVSLYAQASYSKDPLKLDVVFRADVNTYTTKAQIVEGIRAIKAAANGALTAARDDVDRKQRDLRDKANNVCHGGDDCGFKCDVHLLEEMGFEVAEKDHDVFTVSNSEMLFIESEMYMQELSKLSVEDMEAIGLIKSDAEIESEVASFLELQQHDSSEAALETTVNEEAIHEMVEEAFQHNNNKFIKKLFNKAKDAVTHVVHKVEDVGKKVVEKVADVGKKVVEKVADAGCNVGKAACKGGCAVAKASVDAAAGTLEVAKGVLRGVEATVSATLGLIDKILSSFDIGISIGGHLNRQSFGFDFSFDLRLGAADLKFSVNLQVNLAKIEDLVRHALSNIKEWLKKKIPGLDKIIH
eukprot:TRINITY_DN2786_c0_g1_i4.p1 TRINITY_DN2786_c0_g1~~TRINITY_DN2786_c0_g1_i4.p1  ORF type:complete len:1096 (-),score=563.19 TRINITY_DN2786_c0_g1_i4:153-3365(-)